MEVLMTNLTPLKAIKARCIDCCGDDHPRKCTSDDCPLYPFRLGKNTLLKPRKVSDEQKRRLIENLQKNREISSNVPKEI